MERNKQKLSKFLSFILRHKPQEIGLRLDEQGWADVDELLRCAKAHGRALDRDVLREIVATNDKQRFAFSHDELRIKANQGHSIKIDLALEPITPPELLYHGTASRYMKQINQQGLLPSGRHHVHLSADYQTAISVGTRHGIPVVLVIKAGLMHTDGIEFFQSANGVWLTARVEPGYFTVYSAKEQ